MLPSLLPFLALGALQNGGEAEEALRRSLDRRNGVIVDAVVEQPSPGGDPVRFLMRLDGAGRRRTEMVAPAAVQGRLFVDDGTSWTTYNPDTKTLRTHPAPPDEDDLDFRMRLVRHNYRLEIDSHPVVAGRPALRIVATPRDGALWTQRFTVDAATFVPLKTETVDSLGGVVVGFRVVRIAFPARLERDTFEPPSGEGIRREGPQRPLGTKVSGPDEAASRLGFTPVAPRWFPGGFKPQRESLSLLNWGGVTPLAMRLTDGLVRAMVFQYRPAAAPSRPSRPGDGPRVLGDVGDVRVEVVGRDVPLAVRERILAVFVKKLKERAATP